MRPGGITLVGDGIENPWNARTLIDAAALFGGGCVFRDRSGLAGAWRATPGAQDGLRLVSRDDLARDYAPIVALDTLDGAEEIYGFRLTDGPAPAPALIVGNERRGIARDLLAVADRVARIPLPSRHLGSLNVAAAGAVALYYLMRGGGAKLQPRDQPARRRPELLLIGGADHVELGSAIRSAGAFGWERILVEDRAEAWFGADRVTRSERRAAARRGRNPIRLIPAAPDERYAFEEVCVVTTGHGDTPLHRANLARGPRQLIVLPDESQIDLAAERWARLGAAVRFVHLDLPSQVPIPPERYHFRLGATIALAEAARQVGQRARPPVEREEPRSRRHVPFYDRALALLDEARGETVFLEDLEGY